MKRFTNIFPVKHPVIGMIHVQALPGTPNYGQDLAYVFHRALEEAIIYKRAGIDALMIENMHDVPYQKNAVGPEIVSAMTLIANTIRHETQLPMGIQILAAANKEALAVAKAAQLNFIRAEGFVFGHVADEGYIDSQAANLLRYRKQINAEHIAIFTDIKKKHSSHSITDDVDIVETAHAAEFFLSDALVVTGKHTGSEADALEIESVKSSSSLPVIIGSGVNIDNLETYLPISDALIIGSYFKKKSYWKNDLDEAKIKEFMKEVNKLR